MGNRLLDDGTWLGLGAAAAVAAAGLLARRGSPDRASPRREAPADFARRFGITLEDAEVALDASGREDLRVGYGGGTPEQEAVMMRLVGTGHRAEARRYAYLIERGREAEAARLAAPALPSARGAANEFG